MLKEYIAKDINGVFKNEGEFSEVVTINGVSVTVNIDNDRLAQKTFNDFDGVVIGDILFFITAEEFKKIPLMKREPKTNDALTFNGKPCVISNVEENFGIYEIMMQYAGGVR